MRHRTLVLQRSRERKQLQAMPPQRVISECTPLLPATHRRSQGAEQTAQAGASGGGVDQHGGAGRAHSSAPSLCLSPLRRRVPASNPVALLNTPFATHQR